MDYLAFSHEVELVQLFVRRFGEGIESQDVALLDSDRLRGEVQKGLEL